MILQWFTKFRHKIYCFLEGVTFLLRYLPAMNVCVLKSCFFHQYKFSSVGKGGILHESALQNQDLALMGHLGRLCQKV